MDRVSDVNGKQPILSVIIDKERSRFHSMVFKIDEHEQGVISDTTVEKIRQLLKKAIPNIGEGEHEVFMNECTSLINLLYDVEDVEVELYAINAVKSVEDYEKLEGAILESAGVDLEILVR
ncbi:hypothetical protein GOM49_06435 [Clostridium bovifaecis]|uniref:Uncharacterized protein n=1 Tax=Clostridium bovifaecis TaxID=2184719 RepID=A0A6I6EX28_9CLOT|nr:hypothetical protein GOM49_06435 [Clostridium bovifaecis]